MPACCNNFTHATSRRELLKLAGNSFGYLAFAALMETWREGERPKRQEVP